MYIWPHFRCCGPPSASPGSLSSRSRAFHLRISPDTYNSLVSFLPFSPPAPHRLCKRRQRLANTPRPPGSPAPPDAPDLCEAPAGCSVPRGHFLRGPCIPYLMRADGLSLRGFRRLLTPGPPPSPGSASPRGRPSPTPARWSAGCYPPWCEIFWRFSTDCPPAARCSPQCPAASGAFPGPGGGRTHR